jgi:hypothetical protein
MYNPKPKPALWRQRLNRSTGSVCVKIDLGEFGDNLLGVIMEKSQLGQVRKDVCVTVTAQML